MSNFRCSAGHMATLAFGPEDVRLPCPTCGVDVYRYRDAVLEEELAPAADTTSILAPAQGNRLSHYLRNPRFMAGALLLLGAATVLMLKQAPHSAITAGAVIPVATAGPAVPTRMVPTAPPAPVPTAAAVPEAAAITNFHAAEIDSSTVKLTFRLTNRDGKAPDYPALLVHWHGAPSADQVIRRDAYAHPPLPFKAADVVLELARPQAATGIDVKIAY